MTVSTQTTTAPLPPSRSNSHSPRDSLVLKASSSLSTSASSSSTAPLSSNAAQPASPSHKPSQPSPSPATEFASSALTTLASSIQSPASTTTVNGTIITPAQVNTLQDTDSVNAKADLDISFGGGENAAHPNSDASVEASDDSARIFVHPQYLPLAPAQRGSSGFEVDSDLATNASVEASSSLQVYHDGQLHQPTPSLPSSSASPSTFKGKGRARSPSITPRPLYLDSIAQVNGRSGIVSVDLKQSDAFADSPSSSPTYTTTSFSSSSSSIASDSGINGCASRTDAGGAWFGVPQLVLHAPKEDASEPSMLPEEIASMHERSSSTPTASTTAQSAPPKNHHRVSQSSSSRAIPQPLRLSHSHKSHSTTNSLHQRTFQSDDLRTPITPAYNVYSTYTVGAGGVGAVPVGHSISEGSGSSILGGNSYGHHDDGTLERATSTGTDTNEFLHPSYSGYDYNFPSSPTTRGGGMYEYDNFLDSEPAYGEDGHLLPSPSKTKFSSAGGASGLKRSPSGGSSGGGLLRQALKGVGGVTVGIGMGAGRVGRLFVPRFLRRRIRPVLAFLGSHSRPLTAPSLSPSTSLRVSLSTSNSKTAIASASGNSTTIWERWAESPILWLLLYFGLNLSLTLYNKKVLISFPFPYSLTALHAACGSVGTLVMLRMEHQKALDARAAGRRGGRPLTAMSMGSAEERQKSHLNGRELLTLFLFSILYTLNIVVSNASLRLVTVPFHQVVRASTPFFTIIFAAAILGKRCTRRKLFALIPVVVGVGFATYGDYYFTAFGFMLTLLGTVLAALKTILTNCILVKPGAKPTSSVSPAPTSPNAKHTLPVAAEIGHPLHQHVQRSISRPTSPMSAKHEYFEVQDTSRDQGPAFPPSFFGSLFALIKERTSSSSSSSPGSSYEHDKMPVSPMSPYSPVPPKSPHSSYAQDSQYSSGSSATGPLGLPTLTLSPLHLLYLMSPLALVQTLLLAYFTGELARVHAHLFPSSLAALASASAPIVTGAAGLASPGAAIGIGARAAVAGRVAIAMGARAGHSVGAMGANGRFWLLLNGILAFFLNVVSFNANRRVGPLGMSVAANVKQVLTVLCAVTMFNLTITPANGVGIALTLLGGALYAAVELKEKRDREGKRRVG